jgi:hypothetical protein
MTEGIEDAEGIWDGASLGISEGIEDSVFVGGDDSDGLVVAVGVLVGVGALGVLVGVGRGSLGP